MKKLIAILLAAAMLLSLAACGGGAADDPNAGKYLGTTAKTIGLIMDMSEIYPGETFLELKSGGRGTIMLDGDAFSMKWTLEGEAFTMTIDGEDSVGTLSGGVIVVDLMGMGVEMTFVKEGMEAPAAVATYNDAGYWEIIRVDSTDPEANISEEDMVAVKEQGAMMYMELNEDGTGVLFMDEELPITWQDGSVTLTEDALTVPYTLENGEMVLDMFQAVFILRKSEKPVETEPAIPEMEQAGFTEFMEVGVKYPFEMVCVDDNTKTTVAEVIVTDYQIFESAEGYPAKDGYEWRVATLQIRAYDYNARNYRVSASFRFEDYYNTVLHDDSSPAWQETSEGSNVYYTTYTLIHEGREMEAYEEYTNSGWSKWNWAEGDKHGNIRTYTAAYQVPVGYDGVVVGYCDNTAEPDGDQYITQMNPSAFMLFRMT